MMAVERKFIEESINRYKLANFLRHELDRAGFSDVDIQRTPMVTRITVSVTKPGKVIGRKGKTIKDLTDAVQKEFGIDNPQIAVVEVTKFELEPRLVAKEVVKSIEMGRNVRSVLHYTLKVVMNAGALGAEIVASGKIAAKGARAKRLRVAAGYIPKAGEPARLVKKAHVTAYPKFGAIGVLVRIVQPGTVFPDKKVMKPIELPRVIRAAEEDDKKEKPVEKEESK
jgi:small subunit ribosomal protein S3